MTGMSNPSTIDAVFDGSVFRPAEPVSLPPNSYVRITFEAPASKQSESPSFLQVARDLKLDGPPDWASNLDHYLYGDIGNDEP